MVGSTGTLMTMHIVNSKLRKRNESSATAITTVNIESQQQQHCHQIGVTSLDNNNHNEARDLQLITTTTMPGSNDNYTNSNIELERITFARTSGGCGTSNGWVFPPKAPSPNIYNCVNHDALVTVGERNGFKSFKKQFSGRFKRLVSYKKDATSPIPPELKPQLKTIYVY